VGGQSQVVIQNAPTTQTAGASASSTQSGGSGGSSSSTATDTNAQDVSQAAAQTQYGGDPEVLIAEQSADTAQLAAPSRADDNGYGWALATSARLFFASRPHAWSPRRDDGRASQPRPGAVQRDFAPRTPKLPSPPQAPAALGAAAGGSGGGGSLWVFAAFLLPFLLTVPWGTGRQRPSAVRRLKGVVSRLERPG